MPLKLKLRGKVWHIEGRIDELIKSEYYRQTTRKTDYARAQEVLVDFKNGEMKRYYGGDNLGPRLLYKDALDAYSPTPEFAGYLLKSYPYLKDMAVEEITPAFVRNLGPKIDPENATDTWHKQFIVPIRAVINNAHDLGLYPSIIRIKTYTNVQRQKQDELRGKQSRVPKTPADWNWILNFKAAADPHTGLLAQFMFETAARIGQATALVPQDFDCENMRINMPAAKGAPKQWVSLSKLITEELKALPPKWPRCRDKSSSNFEARIFGIADKSSVNKKWHRICDRAGIEHIMPHAAGRHGFATEMLVRLGLDPRTVASAGRWADISLMMKIYAHSEDADEMIRDAIRTGRVQAEIARQSKSLYNKRKS